MNTIETDVDLGFHYPFGEESCELAVLQDRYPGYFKDIPSPITKIIKIFSR